MEQVAVTSPGGSSNRKECLAGGFVNSAVKPIHEPPIHQLFYKICTHHFEAETREAN